MEKRCEDKLRKLTGKRYIFFTDRGNSSILLSLKLAKSLGKEKGIIQDQGGWITYSQFLKKLKLDISIIETDYGIVMPEKLNKIYSSSLLLINSMPGYHAAQEDMKQIAQVCKKNGCLLINDASGSIGRDAAKHGDIILGSFGEWKPVEAGYGGFVAYDDEKFSGFFKENFKKEVKDFYQKLDSALEGLPEKLKSIDEETDKIKAMLKGFNILHRESRGLNVIVRFESELEKMEIIEFCKLHGYEFTLCPRYIRVLENAVSIEVKRR